MFALLFHRTLPNLAYYRDPPPLVVGTKLGRSGEEVADRVTRILTVHGRSPWCLDGLAIDKVPSFSAVQQTINDPTKGD